LQDRTILKGYHLDAFKETTPQKVISCSEWEGGWRPRSHCWFEMYNVIGLPGYDTFKSHLLSMTWH